MFTATALVMLAEQGKIKLDQPTGIYIKGPNAASWPAGSMFSNASDLSRFVITFLNGGRLDNKQVLSPSLIATLSAAHAHVPGTGAKYGYGLQIRTVRGVRVLEHGGARSGYGSFIRMAPEQKFAVLVIGNRSAADLPRTVDKAMENTLTLEPRQPNAIPTPIAMSEAEMDRHVGVYAQNKTKMEILKKEGKLYSRQGVMQFAIEKIGDDRYVVILPAGNRGPLSLIAGADGRTEYVHRGGRSMRRQK